MAGKNYVFYLGMVLSLLDSWIVIMMFWRRLKDEVSGDGRDECNWWWWKRRKKKEGV